MRYIQIIRLRYLEIFSGTQTGYMYIFFKFIPHLETIFCVSGIVQFFQFQCPVSRSSVLFTTRPNVALDISCKVVFLLSVKHCLSFMNVWMQLLLPNLLTSLYARSIFPCKQTVSQTSG